MTERCDRCGKSRVLQDYTPNQKALLRLCAACAADAVASRSAAAMGKAGRKPRSPSQLEDQLFKCALNAAEARKLELWFLEEGYKGTRHQMLKNWALDVVNGVWKR
mgnify:FL=1